MPPFPVCSHAPPSPLKPVGTRQGPAPAALRLLRAAAEDGIAIQHKDDFRSRLQHPSLLSLFGPQRLYEAEHQPGPAKHPLARDGPLPRRSRLDATALAFRTLRSTDELGLGSTSLGDSPQPRPFLGRNHSLVTPFAVSQPCFLVGTCDPPANLVRLRSRPWRERRVPLLAWPRQIASRIS